MRTGLTVSAIGHAALLAWGVVSLPVPKPLNASQVESIPVDFIEISDDTSIDKGVKTAALAEEPALATAARKIADEQPPPPPPEPLPRPQLTPAPPPEPPPPEQPPEPLEQPRKLVPKAETPPPEARAIQPKLENVPKPRLRPSRPNPRPQVAKAKDEKFDIDQITAMLDKQSSPESSERSDQPATFGTGPGTVDSRMTASELDALRARLSQCWSPPIGWTDPSEVRVVLMLFLNVDGSVSGAPQVLEAPGGRYAQTAAESAARAVRRCAPYNLPVEKYEAWKEVRVVFDPTDMGGV